jgi:PAS domain S-box-containing protein
MKAERTVLEHRFLHKDGHYRWIRRYVWHVYDHAAALRETLGCAVDITELKSAEEQLRRFVDGGPDPVITTNSRGQIVRSNAQAQHVFGYPQDALIGHDFSILVADESKSLAMQCIELLAVAPDSDESQDTAESDEAMELHWRSIAGSTFTGGIRVRTIVIAREKQFAISVHGASRRSGPVVEPATTESRDGAGQ